MSGAPQKYKMEAHFAYHFIWYAYKIRAQMIKRIFADSPLDIYFSHDPSWSANLWATFRCTVGEYKYQFFPVGRGNPFVYLRNGFL